MPQPPLVQVWLDEVRPVQEVPVQPLLDQVRATQELRLADDPHLWAVTLHE